MNAPDPLRALLAATGVLDAWQLRTVFDHAAVGLVVQDADGRIIDANAAALFLLGLSRDELFGLTSLDPRWQATDAAGEALPGDEHPAMRTLRDGAPLQDFVMGVHLPEGGRRWLAVSTALLPGRATGPWVVSSFTDVSAPRDLQRTLFDLSSLGIQLIDLERQKVVAVNDALVRMTGYTREELLHEDGHERFAPEARALRAHWAREVQTHGQFGPVEADYLHRGGHRLRLVFHGVRVTDPRHRNYLWLSVQDVSAQRALEDALRTAAGTDRLTGLANREGLLLALNGLVARAAAGGGGFALLFMDVDRFKLVNDTLGHAAGDELLREVAQRLRAHAGPRGWPLARFGGDEFVALLADVADAAAASKQAAALLDALARPYRVQEQDIHTSASLGVALWQSAADDGQTLMRDADTAMYEAKRRGRGQHVVFDDAMRARLTRTVHIENELRHAVARGQLRAVYQPIVDLHTGVMGSVEALLRWDHPELGTVSPVEFIPVAEDGGHILGLGEWILAESCRQWRVWQREDAALAPARVSVNVSRKQLALGPRLLAAVRAALADNEMPAQALQLEITEREVMQHPEQAQALLRELSGMGLRLAMDDFGTGTSSLGCLREYPFHTIKIDKSFVTDLCRDPQVLAVAHATVNVIANLGMLSVAEGIEDATEVAALQAMGCDHGQGYLFAAPLAADRVLAFAAGAGAPG